MTRLAAVTLAVWLAALPAGAQQTQPPNGGEGLRPLPPGGTELFRGLFHFHKLEPLTLDQFEEHDPNRVVVVVLGTSGAEARPPFNPALLTQQVLRGGGAALIAIDEPVSLSGYLPGKGELSSTGERIFCPTPGASFADQPGCVYPTPALPDEFERLLWEKLKIPPSPEWVLFAGLDRVATNIPGSLQVRPSRYTRSRIAGFPPGSRVGGPDGPILNLRDRAFAVAGSGSGQGDETFRTLILADPDVFSNQMMAASARGDAQNLEFANRVVEYLRGPNERTHCLFIENGRVKSRFDEIRYEAIPSLPPLPIPPLPDPLNPQFQQRLTDMANEALTRWEDRDRPNRSLAGRPEGDGRRFADTMRVLAVLLAVMLLLVWLRRFWSRRHEPDLPPVPTDTGRVAGSGPPGSLARRREELLQAGNYTALVRDYLQELFASRGLPPQPTPPPKQPPPIVASGPDARTVRANLRILWNVAYALDPRPVSYTRWKELEPLIEAVRRAAEADHWRFAAPGERA